MTLNWYSIVNHQEWLDDFLKKENEKFEGSLSIYPEKQNIFKALELIGDLSNLKVVLLGQDPYHGVGQAMGLAFSVPCGVKLPPSLRNILKELKDDCGIVNTRVEGGDLTEWANQGVLLLNTALTVREGCPNSHEQQWKPHTDNLIKYISENTDNTIFMLWGGNAKKKKVFIDKTKHHILEANHPSPLSANRGGWFGCKHFSKCNEILKKIGKSEINW